jgi:hypothetical protein
LAATRQSFPFPSSELAGSTLERVAPSPAGYAAGSDHTVLTLSGAGDVQGVVQAVDVTEPPGAAANSGTSGCEAADSAGSTRGNVALVQRGTCTFGTKVANAAAAGAVGVVVVNEAQHGRGGVFAGTLGAPGRSRPGADPAAPIGGGAHGTRGGVAALYPPSGVHAGAAHGPTVTSRR